MLNPDDYKSCEVVRLIDGPTDWRLLVVRRKDGLYHWVIERFWHPAEEDEGVEFGWAGHAMSGLFEGADIAETAGRAVLRRPDLQS